MPDRASDLSTLDRAIITIRNRRDRPAVQDKRCRVIPTFGAKASPHDRTWRACNHGLHPRIVRCRQQGIFGTLGASDQPQPRDVRFRTPRQPSPRPVDAFDRQTAKTLRYIAQMLIGPGKIDQRQRSEAVTGKPARSRFCLF